MIAPTTAPTRMTTGNAPRTPPAESSSPMLVMSEVAAMPSAITAPMGAVTAPATAPAAVPSAYFN